MENLMVIPFWIFSIISIVAVLCFLFAKKFSSIVVFASIIFLSIGVMECLLHAPLNAIVQFVSAILIVAVLIALEKNMICKKDKNLGLAFKPRMFFGGVSVILIFTAFLWALLDNYLANIWDLLSSVHLISGTEATIKIALEKVWGSYSTVMFVLLLTVIVAVFGVNAIGAFKKWGQR